MDEARKRIRRARRIAPTMWAAFALVIGGMVTAALALIGLAEDHVVLGVVLAVVTAAMFVGGYLIYRADRRFEETAEFQRDVTRIRRAKYRSMYRRDKD